MAEADFLKKKITKTILGLKNIISRKQGVVKAADQDSFCLLLSILDLKAKDNIPEVFLCTRLHIHCTNHGMHARTDQKHAFAAGKLPLRDLPILHLFQGNRLFSTLDLILQGVLSITLLKVVTN